MNSSSYKPPAKSAAQRMKEYRERISQNAAVVDIYRQKDKEQKAMARDKVQLGACNKMIVRENAMVKKANQRLCEKAIAGVDTMVGNSSVENRRNVKAALL